MLHYRIDSLFLFCQRPSTTVSSAVHGSRLFSADLRGLRTRNHRRQLIVTQQLLQTHILSYIRGQYQTNRLSLQVIEDDTTTSPCASSPLSVSSRSTKTTTSPCASSLRQLNVTQQLLQTHILSLSEGKTKTTSCLFGSYCKMTLQCRHVRRHQRPPYLATSVNPSGFRHSNPSLDVSKETVWLRTSSPATRPLISSTSTREPHKLGHEWHQKESHCLELCKVQTVQLN